MKLSNRGLITVIGINLFIADCLAILIRSL